MCLQGPDAAVFVSNNKLCGELNGTKSGLVKKNTLDGFKGYGKLDKTTTRESISTQLFCHTVAGSRTKNTHTTITSGDSWTYSFFTHLLSRKTLSRGITACPRNTSSPMSALCITVRISSQLPAGYPLCPPLSSTPGCSSNEHSSFHSGSVVFSATPVEYFSFPTWMMVYTSLVPCLPLPRKPLPLRTVTWTCVGTHFWSSGTFSEDMSVPPPPPSRQTERQTDRLRTHRERESEGRWWCPPLPPGSGCAQSHQLRGRRRAVPHYGRLASLQSCRGCRLFRAPAAPAILQSALRQQQRPSLPLSPCRTGLSAASDVTPLYPPSSNAGRGSSAPTRHMAACTEKSHTRAWAVT